MGYIERMSNKMTSLVGRMDGTDLLVVVSLVIVIGFLCMRGHGSRVNY